MSISASRFVSISPRVLSAGSTDLQTNGLLLTKSAVLPTDIPAIEFSSADAVGSLFGDESDEAKFAQQYFAGVVNQQAAVRTLVIGRYVDQAVPGWIRGGKVTAELDAFTAISDGTLTLRINGENKTASNIDLSGATSLSDVAQKIAAAVTGITGEYSSQLEAFVFTDADAGKDKDVSYVAPQAVTAVVGKAAVGKAAAAVTDLGALLALRPVDGAVISPGADAQTPDRTMQNVLGVTGNWAGFTTIWEVSEEEAEGFAAFAEDDSGFCYVAWSTDKNCTNVLTQANTVPAQLYAKQAFNCTATLYGDYRYAAFFLAIGASIDWSREQGIKVWFAKRAPNLSPNVTDSATADALDAIRCNYHSDVKARNSAFQFFNRGTLLTTQYSFVDTLYGSIWLRNALQTSILTGIANTNRAPYNADGAALVSAWVMDPVTRAKRNGCIDTALSMSESQKTQLMQEFGRDISSDLFSKGYFFLIDVSDPSVRVDRDSPELGLAYTYAGSIQRFSIPVTAVV